MRSSSEKPPEAPHPAPGGPAPGALRRASARGFAWTGGQTVAIRALSLVGFVVLARLLSPRDYGLAALATVFMMLFQMLAASGFSAALVQQVESEKADFDCVFWIGLATGVVLGAVLFAASWPLAAVLNQPGLRPLLQVLSLNPVFVGLGSAPQAWMQRRLAFSTLASTAIVANLVATVVGIAFAFAGLGVWSLIVQAVLAAGLNSVGMLARSGYRPAASFELDRFWPLFATSRNVLGTTLMTFLDQRTDDFLIGGFLGSVQLGIYSVAYRILIVMMDVLANSVRLVAFPVFSRVQSDRRRLANAYHSAARMSSVVAVPCFIFCLVAAPQIIAVFFGSKWSASVPVMQILCLFGAQFSVMQFNAALLLSVGRAPLLFRLTALSTGLHVAAFAVAVPFGIEWVAASYVICAYLVAPLNLYAAARELEASVWSHLQGLGPAVASTAVMAGALLLVARAADPVMGALPLLVVLLAVGSVVYLAALRMIAPAHLREAAGYVRSALPSGRGEESAPSAPA
jgi:polysaccharide transporter, PST family